MSEGRARILVFFASASVLVLEILAGRLMAPYVGVSLETFTGIIGTILAGIATGSAIGGRLADRIDPRRLLGPELLAGGALAWLSLPIVALNARNSVVMTAQTVWTPTSSPPVLQQPSR